MSTHGFIPAGQLFCRSCFCRRDFIVVPELADEKKDPPIECFVCGYTYAKNIREVDVRTGEKLPPNLTVMPMLDPDIREQARAELRAEFMESILRSGARRENFTGVARRTWKRPNYG